jgi:hypothetical protein
MGEHNLPKPSYPGQPAPDEHFVIVDQDVGKSFSVREATTEMLLKHSRLTAQLHKQITNGIIEDFARAIGEAVKIGSMRAILDYEIDRRRRQGGLVATDGRPLN